MEAAVFSKVGLVRCEDGGLSPSLCGGIWRCFLQDLPAPEEKAGLWAGAHSRIPWLTFAAGSTAASYLDYSSTLSGLKPSNTYSNPS